MNYLHTFPFELIRDGEDCREIEIGITHFSRGRAETRIDPREYPEVDWEIVSGPEQITDAEWGAIDGMALQEMAEQELERVFGEAEYLWEAKREERA